MNNFNLSRPYLYNIQQHSISYKTIQMEKVQRLEKARQPY